MKQQSAPPSPELSQWIHSFRHYTFTQNDPAWLTLFPGTGAELWIHTTGQQDGLLCRRHQSLQLPQTGQQVFVIRFRAGALPFFTRTLLAGLIDHFTPPEQIWANQPLHQLQDIKHCNDFAWQCALAEAFLLAHLQEHPSLQRMQQLATAMHEQCAGFIFSDYSDQLNCHRSHLSRQFHATQGVSAKYYHRLCRFERFVRAALFDPHPSLAGLAFEYGYYDQAHLHRDVRQFSQQSPLQLLQGPGPRLFYSPRPSLAES